MNSYYKELISRNFAFIDESLQEKIKDCNLFFAGCGLGSYIAELAVRTGFENFTLADNDVVEISNLNRQTYLTGRVGEKKVDALAEHLLGINPNLNIKKISSKIENILEISDVLNFSSVVINSIDINKIYFELIYQSHERGIPLILPFNIGYGGLSIWIPPAYRELNNFMELVGSSSSDLDIIEKLAMAGEFSPAKYLVSGLEKVKMGIKSRGYNPQIAIASFTVSAEVIACVINYLSNESPQSEKKLFYFDWKEGT